MADFNEVPVIEIQSDNFKQMWPTLLLSIKSSTFVALDAEFSGLGERRKLFAKSMDDRYKGMAEVSKTRSIVSLGISCFKSDNQKCNSPTKDEPVLNRISYDVQTFNILVLCSENYVVEPLSLKFLVDHGFDFNRQYARGLSYYRGRDKREDLYGGQQTIRELFTQLICSKVPIVLHNGLVDLVYFYGNFYAELPTSMQTFLADMEQIFAGGIYDTKTLTEYKARLSASFLEYVFRKCQRDNSESRSNSWSHVQISFRTYPPSVADQIVMLPCGIEDRIKQKDGNSTTPCPYFSAHGWCGAGSKCQNVHDVDAILDCELKIKERKRKRKRKETTDDSEMGSENEDDSACPTASEGSSVHQIHPPSEPVADALDSQSDVKKGRTAGHRAGFDAFMTGFAFAFYAARYGKTDDSGFSLEEFKNKVFISGKDFPLTVGKSSFAKLSKEHTEKHERIIKTR